VPSHVTAAATEVVVAAAVLVVVVGGAGFSLARVRASVGAGAVVGGDPRHGDVDS
jgi:hypothetical protein